MPVCKFCNGTEFFCLDGKFFCAECDTQSQDFVEEQAPEILADKSFTTKKLKERKEKQAGDKGLPWNSVEGFQLIVKAHVKAFIELGINPAIDDVMQQIWFKYVQKSGMAKMDRQVDKDLDADIRFRDYFLQHFKDDILPKRDSSKSLRLRISRSAKRKSGGDELDKEEEWFSVDSDIATDQETDGASSASCSEGSVDSGGYKRSSVQHWYKISHMSNMKVICFCYLALRWCEEPVTIADLIFWAETGRIPYYGAVDSFLPHMKTSQHDHETFSRLRRLEHTKVMWMSRTLRKYIKMPYLPKVNIMELVTRYLYQLNLPLALASYASNLLQKIESSNWPRGSTKFYNRYENPVSCRSPELIAVSIIAVLMKLLFVLNDRDEWKINFDQETCSMHHENERLCNGFTWQNWVKQHLLYQRHHIENEYTLFDHTNLNQVGDLHACMENYVSVILKGTHVRSEGGKFSWKKVQDFAETKQFAFNRLVEKQGSEDVKQEKKEKRQSIMNAYKLLGRGNCNEDYEDLTPMCISLAFQAMNERDSHYVRYREPQGNDDSSDFHQSYSFLLSILCNLMHTTSQSVHDYIWTTESITVAKYLE
ncbi:TATA box-binding protein-associated factor RNA polymerase I subunit B-like [Styela clava]